MSSKKTNTEDADSEHRAERPLIQSIVNLSGSGWLALMIAVIWTTCGIVACVTGAVAIMGDAAFITFCAGVGYIVLREL